jgi:hypothetical protein
MLVRIAADTTRASEPYSTVLDYLCDWCGHVARETVYTTFALYPRWCPTCRFLSRQERAGNGLTFTRDAIQINVTEAEE